MRLSAVIIGLYMILFSIMPMDAAFVANILRSLAGDEAVMAGQPAQEKALHDNIYVQGETGSAEDSEEENKIPPIVEEEDLIAHQPLLPFIFIGEKTFVFHPPHSKLCDNIPAIPTPPPDGVIG